MEPRLIIKTHADVSRPGLFSILIDRCTSPDISSYGEIVSKRMYEYFEINGKRFNKLAAKFTVIMALRFEFITNKMIWDWRGHVVGALLNRLGKSGNLGIEHYLNLGILEKIIYLKYYLESDGAILLSLAKQIVNEGELRKSKLSMKMHFLFREIYESYISLSDNYQKRMELKERLRKIPDKIGYDINTVHHKIYPHVQPLIEFGVLFERESIVDDEVYRPQIRDGIMVADKVINELRDYGNMERRFEKYEYFNIINEIYGLNGSEFKLTSDKDALNEIFRIGYGYLKNNLTKMANINALVDWCCALMLSEKNIILNKSGVLEYLDYTWSKFPSAIRYHVDYRGNRSYIILSDEF